MAQVIKRKNRFTGYYRDPNGVRHSAGTFDTEQEALVKAEVAEQLGLTLGYKGEQTLEQYIAEWLPKADLMPITKKHYESVLRTHVLPLIGQKKLHQVKRVDIRQMLDTLRDSGISSTVRMQAKASLGSAFKALVEAEQIEVNPTHKIRIKRVDTNDLRNVLEPDDFKAIRQALPNDSARMFASFLVMSGCRFGEATELRVKDLNFKTNEVYVQRRVSEVGSKANNGSRFAVIEATKSGHKRLVVLSKGFMQELKAHVEAHSLAKNDLLFSLNLVSQADTLEQSQGNTDIPKTFAKGNKAYTHGSMTAYVHGLCRCEQCRGAMRNYRASQRAIQDDERPVVNLTGHLPRDSWRHIWLEAIAKSKVDWSPRTHDLRHANATLLLKNGVDVNEVKERLGHSSIKTTERYLHRLRHQRSKAAEAVTDFLE
jgi:integrase